MSRWRSMKREQFRATGQDPRLGSKKFIAKARAAYEAKMAGVPEEASQEADRMAAEMGVRLPAHVLAAIKSTPERP